MSRRGLLKSFGLAALPWLGMGRIAAMADTADLALWEQDAEVTRAADIVLPFTVEGVDLSSGYAVDFAIRSSAGSGATDLVTKSVGGGVTITYSGGVSTISVTLTAANLTLTPGPYPYRLIPSTGGIKKPLYGFRGMLRVEDNYG